MRSLLVALIALVLAAPATAAVPAPWQHAAGVLDMPVLRPTHLPGLQLKRVVPQAELQCGAIQEELDGYYGGVDGNGKRLRVAEGQPFYCGDIGDAPFLGNPTIRGKQASLYAYCEGWGCGKAAHRYLLTWRERGIQIVLISRGSPRATLYAIARSMALVADSP